MHFIQQMTTEYVQNIERQKQDEFKRFAKKKRDCEKHNLRMVS